MIGTKLLNRYEITRELGRGGMGVVYMAHDPVLEREVAVKIVTPDNVSAESVARFRREARVVAKMDHPAIVSVYDSGEHEGALFFVMPLVEGKNLRSALKNESLRLGELVDLGIQVAEALEYSHSRGVVHRDIKPENIMVSTSEGEGLRVRVTDFGLAMAPSQDRLTKTATIVGTLAYMSPEQVSGAELTARSDIYSLGTVLYECLVGHPPFSGEIQSLLYRISHEVPLPPRAIQPDIDEELESALLRCLQKDPLKRPTGKELAEALTRYRAKLVTSQRNLTMLPTASALNFQYRQPARRPFVGREKEFEELQHRLNAAIAGECQFVLVGGEAGTGKTRLLEELENLAKARSIPVLHGRNIEIEHALPYQSYGEIIQDYFRTRTGTETPTDFSDLASDLIALFPVVAEIRDLGGHSEESLKTAQETGAKKFEDRTYIFELLSRTITRMSAGNPLVLFLEDLHAADVSIEALDYVVRRLGPTPIFIVGTYRSTDVDKRHRLTKLLSGFKGDRHFELIQLGPMSPSEHRIFLEKLTGGSKLEEALAKRLYQATEGNPYFTTELARSLMDSGAIIKDDSGVCRLSSETAISIDELPATIQQAVEERIERLPDNPRQILSVASVLGRSFDFADLETLADEFDDLENTVELLVRAGFIEEDRQSRSDRLDFSSGVVRDVLYASLPRRKRKGMHRKHAEELEKRNKGRLERVYPQLFDHYAQADVPEKVIEYGFLLARKSLDTSSPEDAIRTIRTVLDFLAEDAEDRSAVGEARIMLAAANRMAGNVNAAIKELEQAIEIFEKDQQNAKVLSAIVAAAEIAWQGMKVNETRRWVERGLDLAGIVGNTDMISRLLSLAATVANLRGEYEKAREYLEQAERMKPAKEETREEVVRGGTLVVALTNPCAARHPVDIAFNEESEILTNVFETIVSTDIKGNLIPHLCERWESLNEGALFLFVLRKNIRFHDGKVLTANEIKSSFEYSIRRPSQALPSAFEAILGVQEFLNGGAPQVKGIVALSENIIQFQLLDRLPIFPALLTEPRTAVAIAPSGASFDGSRFLGTGPFKISSYVHGSTQLEKNGEYWKGVSPYINGIEFRVGLTSAEIAEGFRLGKFDLVRDLLTEDLEEILRDRRYAATLAEAPQKNVYLVVFNTSSPVCGIPEFRKALAGIVRTHDLVRSTLGRLAQPAEGLLPPGILGHDPGRRSFPMDREQIMELLNASGVSMPVELNASVHPILQDRYSSLMKALFKEWSDIGIRISIKTPTIKSYNETWQNNEGIDLLIGRWIADYDDPDSFTHGLFHSGNGQYRRYYASKETDQLIDQARLEQQPEQREKLYRGIERHLLEQGVILPLFHDVGQRVAGSKVQNLALSSNPPYVNYTEVQKSETLASTSAPRTERGILHIPMGGPLHDLDPALTSTFPQAFVLPVIFDTLTRAVEGARIIPWLASSFRAEQGGRQFRFHLREGVRFHDGRRLTARDVRFSFERLLQMKESESRWLLSPIRGASKLLNGEAKELEGLRIISAQEFIIELERPLSFFPTLLTYTPASIIPEGTNRLSKSWRDGCLGTGSYRVAAFEPGRSLKLEANPGYWRPGYPKNGGLEFTFGAPPAEILKGFRNGTFSLGSDLFPSDIETLLHEPEFASKYREIPSLSTYYITLNTHRGPFSDEALRQRFIQAVDAPALVRRTAGRLALPAHSLTPPALLGYEPGPVKTMAPAQKYDGEEIEITAMMHSVYESQYPNLTRELLDNLKQKGFRIRVTSNTAEYEPREFVDADLVVMRFYADYPDADTFVHYLLHSQGGIYGKVCGMPEMDRLIDKGRTEMDPSARHLIYRQAEELIQKHALLLPLFHVQTYCFARPEVDGLELNYFTPIVPFDALSLHR